MSAPTGNLYTIAGGAGAASSVKLINQLLAGVHIAAAAEAMAFGARLGLDTQNIYEIIKNAAGGSWMFENRVPAMLAGDWTPNSQLAIFVKDLVRWPPYSTDNKSKFFRGSCWMKRKHCLTSLLSPLQLTSYT